MKLFDAIFLVEIHDFGTKKNCFSAGFFNPLVYKERDFLFFYIFFSSEKVHEHEIAILYMNRDFGPSKNRVKKRVFWCS